MKDLEKYNVLRANNERSYIVRTADIEKVCAFGYNFVSKIDTNVTFYNFGYDNNYTKTILSAYSGAKDWKDFEDMLICETEYFIFKKPKSPTFYEAEYEISDKLKGRKGRTLWGKVFGL